ncbi:hypothetical protein BpHYR1_032131 [Brachionus plicatilis]|uniref:Uncharacterized protein n=1 Tax=Brachionus plicatilis TaxID=10195 RepID=A0A3M7QN30_BRAPC|nr:hypothetical protein BpHYR1_032131 [Brachionus plicatilis]
MKGFLKLLLVLHMKQSKTTFVSPSAEFCQICINYIGCKFCGVCTDNAYFYIRIVNLILMSCIRTTKGIIIKPIIGIITSNFFLKSIIFIRQRGIDNRCKAASINLINGISSFSIVPN